MALCFSHQKSRFCRQGLCASKFLTFNMYNSINPIFVRPDATSSNLSHTEISRRLISVKSSHYQFVKSENEALEKTRSNNLRGSIDNTERTHINPCNIQMISDSLHQQLFKDKDRPKQNHDIDKIRKHLQAHGLWGNAIPIAKPVDFNIPPLKGNNIAEHFSFIAKQQTFEYKNSLDRLVKNGIPPVPKEWNLQVIFKCIIHFISFIH